MVFQPHLQCTRAGLIVLCSLDMQENCGLHTRFRILLQNTVGAKMIAQKNKKTEHMRGSQGWTGASMWLDHVHFRHYKFKQETFSACSKPQFP